MAEEREEAEYHCRDFDWEDLSRAVESNPNLLYHFDSNPKPDSSLSFSPSLSVADEADADAWRRFHRRHSAGKFFKERRYLKKEFPELINSNNSAKVLEVGCGSGSTVLPILRLKDSITVYACDCSPDVLEKAQEILAAANVASLKQRFHPFVLNFSLNHFPCWLFCRLCQEGYNKRAIETGDKEKGIVKSNELSPISETDCCIGGVDFVTLVFTLSAVPFHNMSFVIAECFSVLKPEGMLLFRDYGLYDMTMLRFPPEQKVGFQEYRRLDGTLSYFFSLESARALFLSAGFIELELEYCCVKSVNRRSWKKMERVWVHGKFQKPS